MAVIALGRTVNTHYYKTDYSKKDVKFRQRALVLRFFQRYFVPNFKMSVLTLPGTGWLFEHMMLQAFPFCSFTGVERSARVYHESRLHIPRNALAYAFNRDQVQDRTARFGHSSITYSRISNGYKPSRCKSVEQAAVTQINRRSNRLVLMDVNDFLTILTEDHKASFNDKHRFVQRFYQKHAVWLDYTGTLTEKTLKAIGHIHLCLYPSIRPKPIVLTFMAARDNFHSKEERIAAIKEAQPNLTIKHVWTYVGAGGCPMMTVCGEMQ